MLRRKCLAVDMPAEAVVESLSKLSSRSIFNIFTEENFRFQMKGRAGFYRVSSKCWVIGSIQKNEITYTIWPGGVFWLLTVIAGVALILVLKHFLTMTMKSEFRFTLGIVLFELLNIMEYMWQSELCSEKIVKRLNGGG